LIAVLAYNLFTLPSGEYTKSGENLAVLAQCLRVTNRQNYTHLWLYVLLLHLIINIFHH